MQNHLTQDIRLKACPYETTCPSRTDRCRVDQMNTAKILVPNKEWLVTENQKKVGAITKIKKDILLFVKERRLDLKI